MRRRSERKKSTDVSSPAPASRRINRRRKSHSVSEDDKNVETSSELKNEKLLEENVEESSGEKERDSSEERSDTRRRRSSRMRTPVKELRASPAKRRTRRDTTPEKKINTIIEEENGAVNCESECNAEENNVDHPRNKKANNEDDTHSQQKANETLASAQADKKNDSGDNSLSNVEKEPRESKEIVCKSNYDIAKIKDENDDESRSSVKSDKNQTHYKDDQDEVKLHTRDNSPQSRSNSSERKEQPHQSTKKCVNDNDDDDEPEEGEVVEKANKSEDETQNARTEVRERILKRHSMEGSTAARDETKDLHKSEEVNNTQDGKTNESSNTTAAADTGRPNINANSTTRKRRWITKKATESKVQILAISTDSLKTLIADVHPVPLSDVQLESSSEVEELASEREEGEQSPSPEPERRRDSIEKLEKSSKLIKSIKENNRQVNQVVPGVGTVSASIQRSPSPARNQASNVLYITNLVRPFTVLQLKGLLARTGKIIENGFWIDRIKSKCFVEYETEDQAIETRHALHGVRWPASNPKCLNVDFGIKNDMLKAIDSTKEDAPKFGQETNKDNLLVSSGWNRERHEDDKKGSRPVREWDVGKKENLDREKVNRDGDRRRERSRDRSLDRNGDRSRDRNMSRNRENERLDRDRDRRQRRDRDVRSNSLSPVRKQKKKEDPPLRLLDDLFRKTKATPCIYWLPLTPEQIAEKEAIRQKRLEEQKQRLKQRELEREKERERERTRQSDRDRDRERDRDHRRINRSSDRRRSRSRDRRRY